MLTIYNIQRCRTYINSILQDFQKFITVTQCRNYYHTPNMSCKIILLKMPSCNYNNKGIWKQFKTGSVLFTDESEAAKIGSVLSTDESEAAENNEKNKKETTDPSKDRTKVISPEASIRYMKSEAYKTTYGNENVWIKYRRNFKGQFVPKRTRKTCIRGGVIACGNPCPICRDEYLVLHYTNVDLLKQFIRPETGEIYSTQKTHICQKRLLQLEVAVKKAKSYGYITHEVPFRKYDYEEYYSQSQD